MMQLESVVHLIKKLVIRPDAGEYLPKQKSNILYHYQKLKKYQDYLVKEAMILTIGFHREFIIQTPVMIAVQMIEVMFMSVASTMCGIGAIKP